MRTVFIFLVIGIFISAGQAEVSYIAYDQNFPQAFKLALFPDEIDEQAFVFFEQSLIVPDSITIDEGTGLRYFDIVRGDKLDRYALLTELELEQRFDLAMYYNDEVNGGHKRNRYVAENKPNPGEIPVDSLLLYKRDMWVRGLRLAYLDYKKTNHRDAPLFFFSAFSVEFETTGDFIAAKLRLYKPRESVAVQILNEMKTSVNKLDGLKKETVTTRETIAPRIINIATESKKQTGLIEDLQHEIALLAEELSRVQVKLIEIREKEKK
jgi:hypothetical protein